MATTKCVRCSKCDITMGVRQFILVHRRPGTVPCPPVACTVCRGPVGFEGHTAIGDPVCSVACKRRHRGARAYQKAKGELADQLDAFRRARELPLVYQRRVS